MALAIKTTERRQQGFYLYDTGFYKLSFSVLVFIEQVVGKVLFLSWRFLSLNVFSFQNYTVFFVVLKVCDIHRTRFSGTPLNVVIFA